MSVLHEQTGLTIRKNHHNKFVVATLHYTADPSKRTAEWKSEARAGMRDADWRKEYEIDYTALSGEHAFPEIVEKKSKIVVSDPYPDFSEVTTFWGGLDYAQRSPASFHVYTIYDGVIYDGVISGEVMYVVIYF